MLNVNILLSTGLFSYSDSWVIYDTDTAWQNNIPLDGILDHVHYQVTISVVKKLVLLGILPLEKNLPILRNDAFLACIL